MIRAVTEGDLHHLRPLIENNYEQCIYIYLDLFYSGSSLSEYPAYYSSTDGIVEWLLMEVDDTAQIMVIDYTKLEELQVFIKNRGYKVVFGQSDIIHQLAEYLSYSKIVDGYIASLEKYNNKSLNPTHIPQFIRKNFLEIARLICSDQNLAAVNNVDALAITLEKRSNLHYGRNCVIFENGLIVSHAATYAESDRIAVIGGVITEKTHRGKGYAKSVVSKLCEQLCAEGKKLYLFYYEPNAFGLYSDLGFKNVLRWSKLFVEGDK